ncbi:hypothetical protein ASG07_07530 [Sphingomonas sp. Leaf343]|nr:hypothetical protein ASG07_07530 [Sphingomonas sp. Leaf343]
MMMVHHVVRAPHPLVRRHRDQDLAPRLQQRLHRRQRRDVVLDMLDHIQHRDQIVRAPLHARQFRQRRIADRPPQPLARDLARRRIDLDRLDRAELRQHRQIVPGAAPDLQNPRARRHVAVPRQVIGQDVAPRPVPPMGGIMRRHAVVDYAVHIT